MALNTKTPRGVQMDPAFAGVISPRYRYRACWASLRQCGAASRASSLE